MGHEVLGQIADAVTDLVAGKRDGLADDVGMELLPLGQHGRERGRSNRAAEIAQHVRQAGGGGRVARRDAGGRDHRDRRQHQCLADGAHDIGHEELVAGAVERECRVHETTDCEDTDADEADVARVEPLHQCRHERNDEELRQAGPGEHEADLLGIVALHLTQILRQDVDGAEQRHADQHIDENADAEVALLEQA
ncbi:hypothetical protein D9M70_390600 [compost metagenome]